MAAVLAVHVLFVVARALTVGGLDGFVVYDGRAYHRLALDPLTLRVEDAGIAFTRPAYWQARTGYPLTAWAASLGGRPALVPAALVLVNLLAIGATAMVAARLALGAGRSAWWGAVPASWAGLLVGLGQDLTEPLAGMLLLATLALARSGHHLLAAAALTAAGLTRETTLVVAVAVVVAGIVPGVVPGVVPVRRPGLRGAVPPWWVGVVPLAVYAGWRTWVRARWAEVVPDPPSDSVLGVPGVELVRYLGSALAHPLAELPNVALLVPTLLAMAVAATAVRGEGPWHERLALAAYVLLLTSLPVWDRGQAYLRWGCEPLLLGWLLLLGRPSAGPARALPALVAAVWVVTATQSLSYPSTAGPVGGWWSW